MSRKKLSDLIRDYQNGTCSEEEREMLEYWYQMLDQNLKVTDENSDTIIEEEVLWEKILQRTQSKAVATDLFSPRQWSTWWLRTAVAVLLVSLGIWGGYNYFNPVKEEFAFLPEQSLIEKANQSDQNIIITLSDGSRVALEPGSKIQFNDPFRERTVFLSGNAFFDITSDSLNPFTVFAGDLVTRVLGTSFFIRCGDARSSESGYGGNTEISVVTGKVLVLKKESINTPELRSSITLTPNQQVIYNQADHQLVKKIVAEPVLTKPIELIRLNNWFQFVDTPLEEVLSRLEEAYQVKIELNEEVRNCPVTADLTDQPLFTKLDIICAALKTSYQQVGTRIIINGGNCN